MVSQPMMDFPFTPDGQADWVREHLKFMSNNKDIVGWFYWYPDAYPGINGGDIPPDIPSYGLFANELEIRPALQEFRVNVNESVSE